MRNPFVHAVGGVLSADIAVPDHANEVDFYSKILTTGDVPLWRDDLMNNLGNPVIGLGARTPEYEILPLQWMPHFQVADVAASAACAIDMGGKELMHGKDDEGQSQWAVLIDPDGAGFDIIPVVPSESTTAQHGVRRGCISWLSLAVSDAASSRKFYQDVIGWSAKPIETEQGEGLEAIYEMQVDDHNSATEIYQFARAQSEIPSVWLIHLPVANLVDSLRRVSECGGEVIHESEEAGRAIIRDPVGVLLALQGSPGQNAK